MYRVLVSKLSDNLTGRFVDMTRFLSRNVTVISGIAYLLLSLGSAVGAENDKIYEVQIEAQPMAGALRSLAMQTGLKIVFFSDVMQGIETEAIHGEYTTTHALDILLADSGLSYERLQDNTISVGPVKDLDGSETSQQNLGNHTSGSGTSPASQDTK